jgi:hypothetical protein
MKLGMAVPDNEYDGILTHVRRSSRLGWYTTDKTGNKYRFYKDNDNNLMSSCYDTNGEKIVRQVLRLSEVLKDGVAVNTATESKPV